MVQNKMESFEQALLLNDKSFLSVAEYSDSKYTDVVKLTTALLDGDYLQVILYFKENKFISYERLLQIVLNTSKDEKATDADFYDNINNALISYLEETENDLKVANILLFLYGISCMYIYCQSNYTGPEINNKDRSILSQLTEGQEGVFMQYLECDGFYPFDGIEFMHLLLLSRVILSFIADKALACWKLGFEYNAEGNLIRAESNISCVSIKGSEDLSDLALASSHWYNARATILHGRILQSMSYDNHPTLFHDCQKSFLQCIRAMYQLTATNSSYEEAIDNATQLIANQNNNDKSFMQLQGMLWLEIGLSCHYFHYKDKGKAAYNLALQAINLTCNLDAALGKRTKYQREDVAQLFLYAKSALADSSTAEQYVYDHDYSLVTTDVKPEEQLEIGRKMIFDVNDVMNKEGEEVKHHLKNEFEAARREVRLDEVNTGMAENIILEGGPKFKVPNDSQGGVLTCLDQAVILALCLDVSNNNPQDGLTSEEMMPYIERVLNNIKYINANKGDTEYDPNDSPYTNWMIYSTGLLERSFLEFEKRKYSDRAMLQIQALIDQHQTKLTITQSTQKCIEESAKNNQRMKYLFQLIYPSVIELKQNLACKYLSCQVFNSALNYFKELSMWDEVVTCYQLLQKPTKAELVVREQLRLHTNNNEEGNKKPGNSPYMYTALADLTGQLEYYEIAWNVSNKRFARAKRTLAKIHHDKGDFQQCIDCLTEALVVQPTIARAWYLRGIAAMKINNHEIAIESFLRCVQQDNEIAEAWANIGAMHMHAKAYSKAYSALLEAFKEKSTDWRILENLINSCINLKRYKEAIQYLHKLVDVRFISNTSGTSNDNENIAKNHTREIQYLAMVAVDQQRELNADHEEANRSNTDPTNANAVATPPVPVSSLVTAVNGLFDKLTTKLSSNALIWDIIAQYKKELGQDREAMDARIKQMRALTTTADWEKKTDKFREIASAASQLVQSFDYLDVRKGDLYAGKMFFQSLYRKLETYLQQNRALMSTNSSLAADTTEDSPMTYEELIQTLKDHATTLDEKSATLTNSTASTGSNSNNDYTSKGDQYGRKNELR